MILNLRCALEGPSYRGNDGFTRPPYLRGHPPTSAVGDQSRPAQAVQAFKLRTALMDVHGRARPTVASAGSRLVPIDQPIDLAAETIPSCHWRMRPSECQPLSGRHPSRQMVQQWRNDRYR